MATVVTKTIKPGGGGDYTTLAAWQTARVKNCVTADVIERAECYGGGNLGQITLSSSWVMDATRRVEIIASEAARHSGKYDELCAYIKKDSYCIDLSSAVARFSYITGICFSVTGSTTGAAINCPNADYTDKPIITDCIVNTTERSNGGYAILGLVKAINCVAYGTSASVRDLFYGYYAAEFLNCTAIGKTGFGNRESTAVVKNCLAQCTTDGFVGTFASASDYNISSIASDAPGAHSVVGTVQFVDAASRDYHLAATDTVARGAGTNLTASGITTDIDGQARPATGAWDIGADQYVAPAPTGPWGTPKFGISQPFGVQKFGVTPWT